MQDEYPQASTSDMPREPENQALPAPPPTPLPKPPGPLRLWWRRWGRQTLLYLTLVTTLYIGYSEVLSFYLFKHGGLPTSLSGPFDVLLYPPVLFWTLAYSAALLGFLTVHEMGHYLFCRRFGLNATLPYYLPNPIIFGTWGAVIRIKSPIHDKRQLFDIGVAGPLAGFAVAVPIYFLGLATSVKMPPGTSISEGLFFGEPLIQKLMNIILFPGLGENDTIVVSPLALVGWFGCLVTAINLLPVSQLDGGHILYAVFGKRHQYVSLMVVAGMVTVAVVTGYYGWFLWAFLVTVLGLRHPPMADESIRLDGGRRLLALVALLVFVVTFTPVPVEVPTIFEDTGTSEHDSGFIDSPGGIQRVLLSETFSMPHS
jgi:Zn-dependent protease